MQYHFYRLKTTEDLNIFECIKAARTSTEFVGVSGVLRGTFTGGVSVLHGIPFLLGGTHCTTAIRSMAEFGHWVRTVSQGVDDISATRTIFASSLLSESSHHSTTTCEHLIRLPTSMVCTDKLPYIVAGFDNLKTAVDPLSEEDERVLLMSLLDELNSLFPVNLSTDVVCDRYTDSTNEVFSDETMDRTDLVLIGGSHLSKIRRHLDSDYWRVTDLTRPGWRISADSVAELVDTLENVLPSVAWDSASVVLQLFDNSIYMVGGPEGEKRLPSKDRSGTYHIDGSLVVADKPTIKGLVNLTVPLLKSLGNSRKLFLTPLARYWVSPCCNDTQHHINYRLPGYLPRLGDSIHLLRDSIRDSLFTKHVPNFRVLCPNKMIGVGQRKEEPSDEEAAASAALWGIDPVHPTGAAYRVIADNIEKDLANPDAKYTNPPRAPQRQKRQLPDLSLNRDIWVGGCSAASTRREPQAPASKRGRGYGFKPSGFHRGRVFTPSAYSTRSDGQRGGPSRGSHRSWHSGTRRSVRGRAPRGHSF